MITTGKLKMKNFVKFTYSEAMLISGASKQISCAIFIFFRFYNLLKNPQIRWFIKEAKK